MARRRVRAVQSHDDGAGEGGDAEPGDQAHAGRDAVGRLLGDLGIVIHETEKGIREGDEQRDPDIRVLQVAPERDTDDQAEPDQQAAHRRRALLRHLRFQRQVADRLTLALARTQRVDHPVAEQHGDQERRHHRRTGAEGDVVQQIESTAWRGKPFIQHQLFPAGLSGPPSILPNTASALHWRKRSANRPIPEAFDPLIKSRSPSFRALCS